MDAAPPDHLQTQIRQLASSVPGVVRIEKCRARKSGLGLLVEIHIEVDGTLSVQRGHEIAHQVSDHLKSSSLSIQHVVAHVEPAVPVTTNTPAHRRRVVRAKPNGLRHLAGLRVFDGRSRLDEAEDLADANHRDGDREVRATDLPGLSRVAPNRSAAHRRGGLEDERIRVGGPR